MPLSERRTFIKYLAVAGIGFLIPFSKATVDTLGNIFSDVNLALSRVIAIIRDLRKEGSTVIAKTMNGKEYERDADVHYPNEDSIEDPDTSCQLFFHAHRDNEYGHYHTFINDSEGHLVHLIMISMDREGKPVALSTLNTWVCGDTYVKGNELKELFLRYKIAHDLFPDKRIALFVENIFLAYHETIFELFEERDRRIQEYIAMYDAEPFEDESIEVWSRRDIEICLV